MLSALQEFFSNFHIKYLLHSTYKFHALALIGLSGLLVNAKYYVKQSDKLELEFVQVGFSIVRIFPFLNVRLSKMIESVLVHEIKENLKGKVTMKKVYIKVKNDKMACIS